MRAIGIVRKLDQLGRVVIPKEIRKQNGWQEGQPIEMFTEKDQLILRGYGTDHKIVAAVEMIEHLQDKAQANQDNETLKMLQRVKDLVEQEK